MSDHADTIREALWSLEGVFPGDYRLAALDALVAERDEAVNARLDSLMRDEATWKERAEAAEAEVARLNHENGALEEEARALREALTEMGVDMSAWDAAAPTKGISQGHMMDVKGEASGYQG